MPVEIVIGHAQADGRHYVREIHTDDLGSLIADVEYLAEDKADHEAIATNRHDQIVKDLADQAKRDEELKNAQSADEKIDAYAKTLPDETLEQIGLTEKEIEALKGSDDGLVAVEEIQVK